MTTQVLTASQTVVELIIEPNLDLIFHPDSYGYRPGRSAKQAMAVTRERCRRYDRLCEFDIDTAFDQIDHKLLIKAVRTRVKDDLPHQGTAIAKPWILRRRSGCPVRQRTDAAPPDAHLGDTLPVESQNTMLRQSKDLLDHLAIAATDGAIGDVKDVYFDDEAWAIRYLVVDAGSWLSSRKVLISPISAGKPDWPNKLLPVSLTREQVKNSPDIDTDMPVTRQHETDYLDYYSYPYYWGGVGLWGSGGNPAMLLPGYAGYGPATAARAEADSAQARSEARQRDNDPHLRSCKAVVGYHIEASDGEIGHVQGLLVDDESWAIRYLVLSTSNWWLGHDVLVAPQWIKSVSWAQRSVAVDLTRDALKQAPWYDPALPLAREMEIAVYKHYGRAGYWHGAAPPADRVTPGRVDA